MPIPIPADPAKIAFSPYQKGVLALLAFLQFTVVLDFMIISPLGAMLMPTLRITPAQFGLVVSVYAFSAGVSGLLAAGFADRYDRKSCCCCSIAVLSQAPCCAGSRTVMDSCYSPE